MPIPFGVSATDFVEAVKFIYKTFEALERQNGAASEITETKILLQRYLDLLKTYERISISDHLLDSETHAILAAIRGQSQACYQTVTSFANQVKQYSIDTPTSKTQKLKGAWHKTKWAHYFAPKLANIRQIVSAEIEVLTSLVLILQLALNERSTAAQCHIQAKVEQKLHLNQQDLHRQTDAILNQHKDSTSSLETQLRAIQDRLLSRDERISDHATLQAQLHVQCDMLTRIELAIQQHTSPVSTKGRTCARKAKSRKVVIPKAARIQHSKIDQGAVGSSFAGSVSMCFEIITQSMQQTSRIVVKTASLTSERAATMSLAVLSQQRMCHDLQQ